MVNTGVRQPSSLRVPLRYSASAHRQPLSAPKARRSGPGGYRVTSPPARRDPATVRRPRCCLPLGCDRSPQACHLAGFQCGLRLLVSPPPQLNGRVEHVQRTHTVEFYSSYPLLTPNPRLESGTPRLGTDLQHRLPLAKRDVGTR